MSEIVKNFAALSGLLAEVREVVEWYHELGDRGRVYITTHDRQMFCQLEDCLIDTVGGDISSEVVF